jgi:hypothetical protein
MTIQTMYMLRNRIHEHANLEKELTMSELADLNHAITELINFQLRYVRELQDQMKRSAAI